jgi:uncharacterized ParB-like nuclease family protein
LKRILIAVALAAVSVSAVAATNAFGHQLSIRAASTKSFYYAQAACRRDPACDRFGVETCFRQQVHVVICRVFNDRNTVAQGRYRCRRLVRIAYTTPSDRKPGITGFGRWQC